MARHGGWGAEYGATFSRLVLQVDLQSAASVKPWPAFADMQNVVSTQLFDCRVPIRTIQKLIWHEWRAKNVPERVPL